MNAITPLRLIATIAVIAALVAACEERPQPPPPPFEIRPVAVDGRSEWSAFFHPASKLAPEKLFDAARGAIVVLNGAGDRLARLACPGGMKPCDLDLWAAPDTGGNRYRHRRATVAYYPHELPAFHLQWSGKLVLKLDVQGPLTTLVVSAAGREFKFIAKSVKQLDPRWTRVPRDDVGGAYDLVHDERFALTEVRRAP